MTADYAEGVKRHRIDLLYLHGKLAALIEMISEADHLLFENVAVSPAFQGRGLGRQLMAHAERIAASLGHREIKLYTNKLLPRTCGSIRDWATASLGRRRSRAGLPFT